MRFDAGRLPPRFVPAIVIILIAAVGAGLMAGSYSFVMAHPTPHRLPVAVVGNSPEVGRFIDRLDSSLNTDLDERSFRDRQAALHAVDRQRVVAVVEGEPGRVSFALVPAAGASVARVLGDASPQAAKAAGVELVLDELKPLQPTDPQGLALFYISLAAVFVGFLAAVQLSVQAQALSLPERFGSIIGYAALGGFLIVAIVDWWLGILELPLPESWGILALTMTASGLVYTMFHILLGRWAILPTWALMILLGNPSSGGAVSWPLLPRPFREIGRWLPPGASVNAQHTAIYFRSDQYAFPYLVLIGWAVASGLVAWVWRRRRYPGS